MSMQALRERLALLNKEAKNILAEGGTDNWDAARQKSFDDKMEEAERVQSKMDATQRLMDADRTELTGAEAEAFRRDPKDPGNQSKNLKREIFAKYLKEGVGALNREEMGQIRNTLGTQTGSQGAFSVQSDIATELIDILKGYRGVRDVAQQITTMDGAPLSYPTSDGTAEVGEWVAENTTAAAADPVFGTVAVNTFKSGSKSIAVPIELMMDSQIDIVAMIFKRLGDRIGRIQNQGFTTGTGSGQPFGVVTQSSSGKVGTTGQTLTVIYDDLVDMVDAIDYAYSPNKWMFSQASRKVVRKIKDTAGRPIWTPSYDAGMTKGTPDELLGYPVQINNDMATMAANAKSMLFGDFNKFLIRDAMQLQVFRFDDSAFMLKGQVGFVAWARCGANLLDTTAVKYYQNSAT
jgi:HK97 family phage major capsid protein